MMAKKQRPAVTTPNRATAERIAEILAKVSLFIVENHDTEALSWLDEEDLCAIQEVWDFTIADMFDRLEPCAALEVESMIWDGLTQQDREELLATRARLIGAIISDHVGKMAPAKAKAVKAMIVAISKM
jgi:hypothetical protein